MLGRFGTGTETGPKEKKESRKRVHPRVKTPRILTERGVFT